MARTDGWTAKDPTVLQIGYFIRLLFFLFAACALALMCANLVQDLSVTGRLPLQMREKIWLFDVDQERSLFTWLSSVGLFTNGLILLALFSVQRSRGDSLSLYWLALALGFFLLSLDEAISVHEKLGALLPKGSSSLLGVSWVLIVLPAVAALCATFLRFLFALPWRFARLFGLAGLIFIGGAVGLELVGAATYGLGSEAFGNRLLISVEESLEVTGSLLFMFGLSRYWNHSHEHVSALPRSSQPRAVRTDDPSASPEHRFTRP